LENKELEIVPMGTRDVPGVMEIEKVSFPIPWSRQTYLAEILHNDRAYYLVARLGGQVAGYVGIWLIAGEGHITNIAVHPQYRGQGIGTKLLDALSNEARQRGASRLTLEVRVSNVEAQRVYTRCGFLKVGIRPQYYLDNNEDALIMWKDLPGEVEIYG
jgi:ribosomal-protein-alanine N-acetyltransferase